MNTQLSKISVRIIGQKIHYLLSLIDDDKPCLFLRATANYVTKKTILQTEESAKNLNDDQVYRNVLQPDGLDRLKAPFFLETTLYYKNLSKTFLSVKRILRVTIYETYDS
ncbi:hypothetical protein KC865_04135 [Candidatus Kaiserbacteria bacterium]|nr:hypothetical protein [Candidatus Kaiserbacteria bacterium]USN92699.1 MAG: hypothetical protein H6782_02705 [Candidatus Nomurabacteria bacterium]